ncbi:hypothetical protein BH20VER1_BH20VER1_02770 [soil metagenome]
MQEVWPSDSEVVLETLRTSPLRETRPEQFRVLFARAGALRQ